MKPRLSLVGLALAGITGLALLDVYHVQLEGIHWFAFSLPFWHHLAALVAGASTAGILFEAFAREEFLNQLKKHFLRDDDLVKLFADEERRHWVSTLIRAQIKDDPTRALSSTIFADVVEQFMQRSKFRSRMHYSISLNEPPFDGWRHGRIILSDEAYVSMSVTLDMTQHLVPRRRDAARKTLNVSIVFGTPVEDLQAAFDDETCIYREHLMLLTHDRDRHEWEQFANAAAANPATLADLGLSVTILVNHTPAPIVDVSHDHGRLILRFDDPGTDQVDLAIRLTAPYPRRMKYFEVVFGEPVAAPHVTFRPGPYADPASVAVVDFLQGRRRTAPTCFPTDDGVEVTFPPPKEATIARWILPRSGLVFLWQ